MRIFFWVTLSFVAVGTIVLLLEPAINSHALGM